MVEMTNHESAGFPFEKQTNGKGIKDQTATRKGTTIETTLALRMGIAVPFLYFGVQLAAAPFYPGYSFLTRDASTLGSPGSSLPAMFNVGAICVGILLFIAAWGFLRAFRFLGVRNFIAWPTTLAIVSSGLGCINAGMFPLPYPRHTESVLALCGVGIFLLPFLLPLAIWKLLDRGAVAAYFVANIIALFALFPIMSGLVQRFGIKWGVDMLWYQTLLNNYHGLLQRIFALIVFVPIGVSALFLSQRLRREESSGLRAPRLSASTGAPSFLQR
jgi:hypothetical membrane protein